jgi:hypothetical protein
VVRPLYRGAHLLVGSAGLMAVLDAVRMRKISAPGRNRTTIPCRPARILVTILTHLSRLQAEFCKIKNNSRNLYKNFLLANKLISFAWERHSTSFEESP